MRRGGSPDTDADEGPAWSRRLLLALAPVTLIMMPRRSRAAADTPDDKPFADHRLALQLSDRDAEKHALVLSVANNLLTAYGPDNIAMEVVAFGPGVDLLRAESRYRRNVDSLVSQGVRFDVCMNTIETIERRTGEAVALNPHARPVTAGVAQLLELAEQRYTIVRP